MVARWRPIGKLRMGKAVPLVDLTHPVAHKFHGESSLDRWMRGFSIALGCLAIIAIMGCLGGCSSSEAPANSSKSSNNIIDPQQVQSSTTSFADRYMTAMGDAYDQVEKNSPTPQAKIMAQRLKIYAAMGALGNAVDPNPVVGLMDMALMVTLTREITEEPWMTDMFGAENVQLIVATVKTRETDIWAQASTYLTVDQIAALHQIVERWRQEHPDQRFVSSARLADYTGEKSSKAGGLNLVNSAIGLVKLDPFNGLDPAVRQVEESRILAERVFFYTQHMPTLLSWQLELTYLEMLEQPEMRQLFANTTTVAGSTTQFTDASGRFASTLEDFRRQLPDQQSTLVAQLNSLIAEQRDAALQQATTEVSAVRDATVSQLNSTANDQQALMTQNLQVIMDRSIDRLYMRLRMVVLIAVGAILAAFLFYRWVVAAWFGEPALREKVERRAIGRDQKNISH
jgi:hypothetical protein